MYNTIFKEVYQGEGCDLVNPELFLQVGSCYSVYKEVIHIYRPSYIHPTDIIQEVYSYLVYIPLL